MPKTYSPVGVLARASAEVYRQCNGLAGPGFDSLPGCLGLLIACPTLSLPLGHHGFEASLALLVTDVNIGVSACTVSISCAWDTHLKRVQSMIDVHQHSDLHAHESILLDWYRLRYEMRTAMYIHVSIHMQTLNGQVGMISQPSCPRPYCP